MRLVQLGEKRKLADETKAENKDILMQDDSRQLENVKQQFTLAKKGVSNADAKNYFVYKLIANIKQLKEQKIYKEGIDRNDDEK